MLSKSTELREFDWRLFATMVFLVGIGVFTIFGATYEVDAASQSTHYLRQMFGFLLGLAVIGLLLLVDYRMVMALSPVLYAGGVLLLVLVLVMGEETSSATRWIRFGFLRFQPAEVMKLATVILLARYLDIARGRIHRFPYFAGALAIAAVPALLILFQPDLGTAMIFVLLPFLMLYLGGARIKHLVLVIVAGLAMAPLAWKSLEEYQQDRLLAFVNPQADPLVHNWQPMQAQIGIGGGQLLGKFHEDKWLAASQSRLDFLPEPHTDFVFAVFGEQWGFVGVVILLTLMWTLVARGTAIAREASDFQGNVLASGLVALIALHMVINIAVTLGLMPVTGLPLPFMSYGRSFLLVMMACVGLLLNVRMKKTMF